MRCEVAIRETQGLRILSYGLTASNLAEFGSKATHPCPCGYMTDPKRECRCSPNQISKYRQRISGPLLDRIDLHVEVPAVDFKELSSAADGEPSEAIRSRVEGARGIQSGRFGGETAVLTNASMPPKLVRQHCVLDSESSGLLEQAMNELSFCVLGTRCDHASRD